MKNWKFLVAFILLTLVPGRAAAQEQTTAGGIPIAEIPAPPPLDLPLVAPERVPETANFFSAGHDWPPLPFSPYREVNLLSNNVPTYFLKPADRKGGMPFLLFDDRAIVAIETMEAAAQEKEALVRPMNKSTTADSTESSEPKTLARGLTPMTNDLQLDIADVTNGIVSLDILNPTSMTNDPVWDVWMALQFSGAPDNWTWIARTEPGQTNMLVTLPSETEAYFRLGATNNDVDGDGILDSWMSKNFAHVTPWASDNTRATDDFDGDGTSNYDSFIAGTSPNRIAFHLEVSEDHVLDPNVAMQIFVEQGVPFRTAVLADTNDFVNATWSSYQTNVSAIIGTNEGRHSVWVGLRGHPVDSEQVWQEMQFYFDRTPPQVVITNPAVLTTSRPMIQLQGFASEPVSGLWFDITNEQGLSTNLPGFVTEQYLDPATVMLTTNFFQCYDVDLTLGTNVLTIWARDFAGNLGSTNLTIVFSTNGDVTAPTVQVDWPENDSLLCGDDFTVRGLLDDPTATVTANLISTNGVSENLRALVERDGHFWLENLSLTGGTNTVVLHATDAAGNTSTNVVTVTRSEAQLTINLPDGEQVLAPTVTITGTVADDSYAVWVNGVEAVVNSDGTWQADNVPTGAGVGGGSGTAKFSATAYPAGQHPPSSPTGSGSANRGASGSSSSANPSDPTAPKRDANVDLAPAVYVLNYSDNLFSETLPHTNAPVKLPCYRDYHLTWEHQKPATLNYHYRGHFALSDEDCTSVVHWPPDQFILPTPNTKLGTNTDSCAGVITNAAAPNVLREYCDVVDPRPGTNGASPYVNHYTRNAKTALRLFTGGKAESHKTNLFSISAPTVRITNPRWHGELPMPTVPINPGNVWVGELGKVNTNGWLFAALPDNAQKDVTPRVAGEKFYAFHVTPQKHRFVSQCYSMTPTNRARSKLGVGEEVNVSLTPPLPVTSYWLATAGGLSSLVMAASQTTPIKFTAPSNATTASVIVSVPGARLANTYEVLEPTGIDHVDVISLRRYEVGHAGAGMKLQPYLSPTNVSFYRLTCEEIGNDASDVLGFFTQFSTLDLTHKGPGDGRGDTPIPILDDNSWDHHWDNAFSADYGTSGWTTGSFTWEIPSKWRIGDGSWHTNIVFSDQHFTIAPNGTMTVTKFGKKATRTINEQLGVVTDVP